MHHEEGEAGQLDPWTPGSWLTGQPRRWALSHMNIPQLGQGRLDDNGTNPKTTSFLFFFFFWFLFFSFFSDSVVQARAATYTPFAPSPRRSGAIPTAAGDGAASPSAGSTETHCGTH